MLYLILKYVSCNVSIAIMMESEKSPYPLSACISMYQLLDVRLSYKKNSFI